MGGRGAGVEGAVRGGWLVAWGDHAVLRSGDLNPCRPKTQIRCHKDTSAAELY